MSPPAIPALDRSQRIDWLRLARSEQVGPVTFRDIINHYGSAERALSALPSLARFRRRPLHIASRQEAERELTSAERLGATLVVPGEPGYPPALAAIDAPPPLLYVMGRKEICEAPIVAIVGARDASAAGRAFSRTIAKDLAAAGFVIASGLARGIDAAAHEASLETGTIAVVAGGIDVYYPPEHEQLQRAIGERGLLIAESPPGLSPRGRDFPRRNRIISGAAIGVLVVEAASRSGSRITARFAADQGREVFAVPGHPLDPRAAGTNQLLKDGATLVTTAADIIETLRPMFGLPLLPGNVDDEAVSPPVRDERPRFDAAPPPDGDRQRVVEALGPHPVEVDRLARECNLPLHAIRVVLLELDLAGRLERHGGDRVSLSVVT